MHIEFTFDGTDSLEHVTDQLRAACRAEGDGAAAILDPIARGVIHQLSRARDEELEANASAYMNRKSAAERAGQPFAEEPPAGPDHPDHPMAPKYRVRVAVAVLTERIGGA